MKIKPTNIPVTRKKANDPLDCLGAGKPTEISDEEWESAKSWAHNNPARIPSEIRELAYRRFYQQYSFEDIASKFDIDVGCVIYTAIYENWFNKIKKEKKVRGSDGIERLDKDMRDVLTDIVQGLSAAYTHQLQSVMLDPSKANECQLIPKNLKEVQILFNMIQTLQSKDIPTDTKTIPTVTNVNVQNLIAGNTTNSMTHSTQLKEITSNTVTPSFYDNSDNEEEDEGDDELDLLLRAKGGIPT
jgi:hypothetical protein